MKRKIAVPHSLRVKITAVTISAILFSLAAFAAVSFFTVGQEASASSAEKMRLLSENAQQSLDASLNSIEQAVEMTSHIARDSLDGVTLVDNGVLDSAATRSPEKTARLDAYISEHCARVQEAFHSVASHTSSIVTYYYCINPEVSVNEHGFFYSSMGKVGFERREPLDARKLDPNDRTHTTWYYTPIERGAPSWVGPYRAHFLGEVMCESFLTPIYKSGVLIGVMGMDILLDTMVDQIASLEVYQTGFACLLDTEGKVLYHPTLELGSTPPLDLHILEDGGPNRDRNGAIRYTKNGEPWQLSYSTLVNGMKLVVVAPVHEVIASWLHLLYSIPLIALAVLLLFVPGTLFAMRTIIQPLNQLTDAAHSLSSGKYDVKLDYTGDDEVGELTNAFRLLRDHLSIYISNLDNRMYTDTLTGVKNSRAFNIYVARIDDTIRSAEGEPDLQFAIALFVCMGLDDVIEEHGPDKGDEHVQSACRFICRIFPGSPVFRLHDDTFAVFLQERDFANRNELFYDFGVRADGLNNRIADPWKKVSVTKGMATFDPAEDDSVEAVLERAARHME